MTADGATLVFVGPTLTADEVRVRLPCATVRPPVAVGDVMRALHAGRGRSRVARIAIIDGYFERMAAVWHKELLLALERGIAVWGAASMGALRAAELAPYGMVGIGAIYRAYARGDVVADDAVAVAHLPAEYGYRATSDALVDLHDGLARAAAAGVITRRTLARLGRLASVPFYRERSWTRVIADGRAAGVPEAQLAALAAWPKPSRKADDARLLLRRLAADRPSDRTADSRTPRGRTGPTGQPTRAARAGARVVVPRTWALRRLRDILDL